MNGQVTVTSLLGEKQSYKQNENNSLVWLRKMEKGIKEKKLDKK